MDGENVSVGIDRHSFASEIVDIAKVKAEGPIFGLVLAKGPERRDG